MKRPVDIAIISDVHLGTYGCHAKELLQYLRSIQPGMLILNGDFLDIWQFNKRYFPQEHIQVIQRILKMASKGTRVYYLTGNHDDALRRYSDFSAGNIHLRDQLVLQLHGKQYWIFHGDVFDVFIRVSPWWSKLGGKSYDWLIRFNRWVNNWRKKMGLKPMSFASRIKQRVKKAVKFIGDFEDTALRLAAEEEYDYVICGHIHRPQMRTVEGKDKAITYLNSGDWVESLTALEYKWGAWSLYQYQASDYLQPAAAEALSLTDEAESPEAPLLQEEWLEQLFQVAAKPQRSRARQ